MTTTFIIVDWFDFAFDLIYMIAKLVTTLWAILSAEMNLGIITLTMWQVLSGIGIGVILVASFIKHVVPLL